MLPVCWVFWLKLSWVIEFGEFFSPWVFSILVKKKACHIYVSLVMCVKYLRITYHLRQVFTYRSTRNECFLWRQFSLAIFPWEESLCVFTFSSNFKTTISLRDQRLFAERSAWKSRHSIFVWRNDPFRSDDLIALTFFFDRLSFT